MKKTFKKKSVTTITYCGGIHSVTALLEHRAQIIDIIYYHGDSARIKQLKEMATSQQIMCQRANSDELDRFLPDINHQGVIAACTPPTPGDKHDLLQHVENISDPLLLILDGVQDPHNVGACLRSANAAGVNAVIIPKDRACGLTPTVLKVAAGAALLTPIFSVNNLVQCMQALQQQGIWLYGLAGEAKQDLYQASLTGGIGLVLGAEQKGLRQLTRQHCDELYKIPMVGSVASINVSVAAGIALFEAQRQRSLC